VAVADVAAVVWWV